MANASLMYITLSFYTMVRHIEEHLLSDGQSPKKKRKKKKAFGILAIGN